MEVLQEGPVDRKNQGKIATALGGLLADKDIKVREHAVKTLVTWATDESIPLLVKAIDDDDLRKTVIPALGKLKAEKAIPVLAGRLTLAVEEANLAVAGLVAMGEKAEDAMMEQLMNANPQARHAACLVLEQVGTKKCLALLLKRGQARAINPMTVATARKKIQARERAKAKMKDKDKDKPKDK
jgi:HEAT repeat protein